MCNNEVTVVIRNDECVGVFSSFAKAHAWVSVYGADGDGYQTLEVDKLINADFLSAFEDYYAELTVAKRELGVLVG